MTVAELIITLKEFSPSAKVWAVTHGENPLEDGCGVINSFEIINSGDALQNGCYIVISQ